MDNYKLILFLAIVSSSFISIVLLPKYPIKTQGLLLLVLYFYFQRELLYSFNQLIYLFIILIIPKIIVQIMISVIGFNFDFNYQGFQTIKRDGYLKIIYLLNFIFFIESGLIFEISNLSLADLKFNLSLIFKILNILFSILFIQLILSYLVKKISFFSEFVLIKSIVLYFLYLYLIQKYV